MAVKRYLCVYLYVSACVCAGVLLLLLLLLILLLLVCFCRHAGYFYSGSTAGHAYRQIDPAKM